MGLANMSFCLIAVSPDILSAPMRQEIPRGSPSGRVQCEVTGGRRTVDWWKNQLFIASSNPDLNSTGKYSTIVYRLINIPK